MDLVSQPRLPNLESLDFCSVFWFSQLLELPTQKYPSVRQIRMVIPLDDWEDAPKFEDKLLPYLALQFPNLRELVMEWNTKLGATLVHNGRDTGPYARPRPTVTAELCRQAGLVMANLLKDDAAFDIEVIWNMTSEVEKAEPSNPPRLEALYEIAQAEHAICWDFKEPAERKRRFTFKPEQKFHLGGVAGYMVNRFRGR